MHLNFLFSLGQVATSWLSTTPQNDIFEVSQFHTTQAGKYDERRPVVLWHGLGDNYNSSGMVHMGQMISQIHPEVLVYFIKLNEDPDKDQQASLVGDINVELENVCEQIQNITELQYGFDAIGNSQGGLLLRGLLERCEGVKIFNLITFGSPHMGVMDLPMCSNPKDWVCKRRNALLKKQVWQKPIQHSVIPAQYFRDPYDYENYIKFSNFLADINNESLDHKKYRQKLQTLENFVMVKFISDTTVVPKESAHFNDIDISNGEVIPLRETHIYKSDLLGLKKLDDKKALHFFDLDGGHMQIPETFLVDLVNDFLGARL